MTRRPPPLHRSPTARSEATAQTKSERNPDGHRNPLNTNEILAAVTYGRRKVAGCNEAVQASLELPAGRVLVEPL